MAKRKKTTRSRRNPAGSYSKANIALGTTLASVAPRFAGGNMQFLALLALLPKMPVAVKVMSTAWATKTLSKRFLGGE